VTTEVNVTVTAVEFLGPFFISRDSYTDYYFVCRLSVRDSDVAVYDVALTFDGEVDRRLPVKSSMQSTRSVTFTPADFGRHFGQRVKFGFHPTQPTQPMTS